MKDKLTFNLFIAIIVVLVSVLGGWIIAQTGAASLAIIPMIAAAIIIAFYVFKNPFFGFLLIVFFLPFERVPTVNFSGVDIKINTILGFITLFSWVVAMMFNAKKWPLSKNTLALPIALFVIAMLLSLTQAVDLTRAVEILLFVIFTIALSFLATNMITDEERLKKVIKVLFISATIVGLFGLFQFFGDAAGLPQSLTLLKTGYTAVIFGFPRIQAFSLEPLFFADYLLIPLSLSLAYFMSKDKIAKHWTLAALLILLLINFILTVSRGAYLGLVVTLLLFIPFYIRRIFSWRNLLIVVIIAVSSYGVFFALSHGNNYAITNFVKHVTNQDSTNGSDSITSRLDAYKLALSIYNRYPQLGIGLGNYGPYAANYPQSAPITGWAVVNNEFLEILAETGLVGAITFGLILLVIIWRSLNAIKVAADPFLKTTMFALFAAFLGILTQYNFFSTLYIIHIWVLIGLMVGVQNLIFRKENRRIMN